MIKKLNELDIRNDIINNIISGTKHIFPILKRNFFKGDFSKPKWENMIDKKSLVPALLIGGWTNSEGDQEVLESLCKMNPEDYIITLTAIKNTDDPFIIHYEIYGEKYFTIANVEEAWEILNQYIKPSLVREFLTIACLILFEIDPKFDLDESEHFYASIKVGKSPYSIFLRDAIIRTLFSLKKYGYENEVNKSVEEILKNVNTEKEWFAFSEIFNLMIEVAPERILKKIESEIEKFNAESNSGFLRLFLKEHTNTIHSRNYYTQILFGLEKVLFVPSLAARVIQVFAFLASLDIEYAISNTPLSILQKLFLPFFNELSIDNKIRIQLLSEILTQYDNVGWEILKFILTTPRSGMIYLPLNKPELIQFDPSNDLLKSDEITEMIRQYSKLIIDYAGNDLSKIELLFDDCTFFQIGLEKEVFDKANNVLRNNTNETEKLLFYNKLIDFIYKNRFHKTAKWALPEPYITKIAEFTNKIEFEKEFYKGIFLFNHHSRMVPVLEPVPYNEKDYIKKNELKVSEQRMAFINAIKGNKNKLFKTLDLLDKRNPGEIGIYIAEYFSNNTLDWEIIFKLEELDSKGILTLYLNKLLYNVSDNVIWKYLNEAKDKKITTDTVVSILGFFKLNEINLNIIEDLDEKIVSKFWRSFNIYSQPYDQNIEESIFGKFLYYKNFDAAYYLLEKMRNNKGLHCIEFLENLMEDIIKNDRIENLNMFYLSNMFDVFFDKFGFNDEFFERILKLEIFYLDLLEEKNIRYIKKQIENKPDFLAAMIAIVYKPENQEIQQKKLSNEEKIAAKNAFIILTNLKFCPFQKDTGKIEFTSLEMWIKEFKTDIEKKDRTSIGEEVLGEFLSYSIQKTIEANNNEIAEEESKSSLKKARILDESICILIDKFYTEYLSIGFQKGVLNSRGGYWSTGGKDEKKLSIEYEEFAKQIAPKYKKTASLFYELSKRYRKEAINEEISDEYDF